MQAQDLRSPISLSGLRGAAGVLGPRVALPLAGWTAILATMRMAGDAGQGLVIFLVVLVTSLAVLAFMLWRNSPFHVFPLFLVGILAWSFLWGRAPDAGMPLQFDYAIVADRFLGLGEVPTLWLQERFHTVGAFGPHEVVLSAVYSTFFFAPYVALLTIWQFNRQLARTYVLATLATFYAGLAIMYLLPTAPPWMAGEHGVIDPVRRVLHDQITGNSQLASITYESPGVNNVAAMPSLHMASTVLVALAAAHARRAFSLPAGLYALAMGVALVYLGEHYVIDAVVGTAIALVAWYGYAARLPHAPTIHERANATEASRVPHAGVEIRDEAVAAATAPPGVRATARPSPGERDAQ